jgi:hypothetical protein
VTALVAAIRRAVPRGAGRLRRGAGRARRPLRRAGASPPAARPFSTARPCIPDTVGDREGNMRGGAWMSSASAASARGRAGAPAAVGGGPRAAGGGGRAAAGGGPPPPPPNADPQALLLGGPRDTRTAVKPCGVYALEPDNVAARAAGGRLAVRRRPAAGEPSRGRQRRSHTALCILYT